MIETEAGSRSAEYASGEIGIWRPASIADFRLYAQNHKEARNYFFTNCWIDCFDHETR
jgi:hypothetical protein